MDGDRFAGIMFGNYPQVLIETGRLWQSQDDQNLQENRTVLLHINVLTMRRTSQTETS